MKTAKERKIGIIGLGYVGLPVAVAFARKFPETVGFDISRKRVEELQRQIDINNDVPSDEIQSSTIRFTADEKELKGVSFFVVAVPTPIDADRRPDLTPLKNASRLVGRVIEKGAIVVFESTVYPGVTEDICGPLIEEVSGLKHGDDFWLGYSPERINPGDREHTLERIIKVVSGDCEATLDEVARVYGAIVTAGIHRAETIKVAEAAKVIENTQRDLNIALMNELAIIFDRMGVSTKAVLDAASTKWNFLRFSPGLVGGHCIGVDPYYLTTKAEQLGYSPEVILAGRRINDGMGSFIAEKTIKLLIRKGVQVLHARVGILGLTFKENVSDLRNTRVVDIVNEFNDFGTQCLIHDPVASPDEAWEEFGIRLSGIEDLNDLDALILAVPHSQFTNVPLERLLKKLKPGGVFIDVKAVFEGKINSQDITYWSL